MNELDRNRQPQAKASYFDQAEESRQSKIIAGVGAGVLAVGGAYATYKLGLAPDLLDSPVTPQPNAVPEIVDGFVVVNESLREVSPVVALGAAATGLYYGIRGRLGSKGSTLNEMSKAEYSGVDEVLGDSPRKSTGLMARISQKTSKMRRGTGVATLAVLLTGATSGVEHEIANGPLRPIDKMYELLAPESKNQSMILQSSNNTFMDDSDINKTAMDNLVSRAALQGTEVVPFDKKLFNMDGKSAMQISIPADRFKALTGESVDESCETVPVIVDETLNKEAGQTVSINGTEARIVGVEKDIAQMNRSIGVLPDEDMRRCLQDETDESYFGAVVPEEGVAETEKLIDESELFQEAEAVDRDKFEASNRKFWRANGTPILLQLIAYVGLFAGFAAAGERRNALQRNMREIGTLNAAGVSMKSIQKIENRRALRQTTKAAIIAAPAMPVVAGVFNMAEIGLKVGVGLRELAVGYAVTLAAKLYGGRRAVKQLEKNMELSQAVKG